MKVPHRFVLSAALVVWAAAHYPAKPTADPCTTAPIQQPRTIWVTDRPEGATLPPKPQHIPVKTVCQLPDGKLKGEDGSTCHKQPLPGAFKPWVVYNLLKANGPFIKTVPKDLMGGQTLKVQNAGYPLQANDFTCVKEGNEWKARVLTTSINKNLLTIKRYNGWCEVLWKDTKRPLPTECSTDGQTLTPVEKCLLQDISLYRGADAHLGLRLDYGNCPIAPPDTRLPGTKKAIIMVGLKRVPDTTLAQATPNLKGFFQEVCNKTNITITLPAVETQFDLTKAKAPGVGLSCFAATADMEDMSALDHDTSNFESCFNDAVVYTMLDVGNRFPVLPVMDSDYQWLLSKLPWSPKKKDLCDPADEKQIIGSVQMDRVCLEFEGLQNITCTNTCGKICNATRGDIDPQTTTKTPFPPEICLDCETNEAIYAFLATILVVFLSYYTYLSNSLDWVAHWFFVPLRGDPHRDFNDLGPIGNQAMIEHHQANRHLYWPAVLGLFAVTGVWSFVIYYLINILDTCFCKAFQIEQCVRTMDWQHEIFDEAHYMNVIGTADQWETNINAIRESILLNPFGGLYTPWGINRAINIDVCPCRLLGMIFTTWICTFLLMCWWRREQKVAIMKTTIKQEVISEEQGPLIMHGMQSVGGSAVGIGGGLTQLLGFFGGGQIPAPQ